MWTDIGKTFREIAPTERFGNVFIFRGTFPRPTAMLARRLYNLALYEHVYVPEPDAAVAVELLTRSVELEPKWFCSALELGNQYLKLGDRESALRAYRTSYEYAPQTDSIYELLGEQVHRLETEPMESIAPLRNPGIE
jgi:tetratricopeptide (TPR) repeat protein